MQQAKGKCCGLYSEWEKMRLFEMRIWYIGSYINDDGSNTYMSLICQFAALLSRTLTTRRGREADPYAP